MARPPIREWNGQLFRRQLNAVLDWLEDNLGGGGGGGATNLGYDAPTRTITSSTGDDTILPLAGAEAGLMSAADKTKLDAQASNAALRDRTTHTGVQPSTTISDLAATVQAYPLDVFADPVASVQFAQQQALQFVIENRTSDPGSPAVGELWLRTDL